MKRAHEPNCVTDRQEDPISRHPSPAEEFTTTQPPNSRGEVTTIQTYNPAEVPVIKDFFDTYGIRNAPVDISVN